MMRRLLAASIVVTVALVALSAPGAGAAPDTTGMKSTTVKGAGVSLSYPGTWTVVPVTKKSLEAMEKALSKKNPKVAALLSSVQDQVGKFKFYATNVPGSPGAVGNVNVVSLGRAPDDISLADVRDHLRQIVKGAGGTLVDVKRVKVSGKGAFRSDDTFPITQPDGTIAYVSQGVLLIPDGSSTPQITVTAPNDATGAALINSVLASVHRI
jgi:hypothetical protein